MGRAFKHFYYHYRLNHRPFFKARLEQSLQISDVVFRNPNSTFEDRSRAASMQANNSVCVSLTVSTSERHLPREAQQEHVRVAG